MPQGLPCPRCGADLPAEARSCWLCRHELVERLHEDTRAGAVAPTRFTQASNRAAFSFSLSTLMLVMTLVAVVCGMLTVAPGLSVVIAIVLVPVLVRTAGVVRKREEVGLATPPVKRAVLFLSSLYTTLAITIFVGLAAVGTFGGIYCFVTLHGPGWSGFGQIGLIVAAISTPILILAIVLSWKSIGGRWRRDTEEP